MPSDKKICPFCAESIQQAANKCRFCGEFLDERRDAPRLRRRDTDPGVAAALSFVIPGLGHIYIGQIAAGLVIGTICSVLHLVGILGIHEVFILSVPMHIALIFYAFHDATGSSRPRQPENNLIDNTEKLAASPRSNSLGCFALWIIVSVLIGQMVITLMRH
jgi:TM2 domain-containing membrane protein YozV